MGVLSVLDRLRGFERVNGKEGRFSVVQEWHCEMP